MGLRKDDIHFYFWRLRLAALLQRCRCGLKSFEMASQNPPKDAGWGPNEIQIQEALEAETPVQDVKFDELDDPATDRYKRTNKLSQHGPCNRGRSCVACALGLVVVIIAATLLSVLLPRSTTPFNVDQFGQAHLPPYSWEAAKNSKQSPQAQALEVIRATASAADPIYRLKQRYALAVLYFSTVSLAGDDNDRARLSDANECNWLLFPDIDTVLQSSWGRKADVCTRDKRLQLLVLQGDSVNGTIPREIDMLSDLLYINLGKSSVHGAVPTQL
jgi:hypothetical protein